MSKGAIDCSLVLLHILNAASKGYSTLMNLNECTVILLNQRSTQMNEYFALMTGKRRNSSVSNTELLNYRFFRNETPTAAKPEVEFLYSRH